MNVSTNPRRRPLVLAAAIAAMLSVGACSSPAEPASPSTAATSAPPTGSTPSSAATSASAPASPSPSTSSPANTDGNSALLAAGALGAKEVSGGTVISIETERDGWEVHVVTDAGNEQQLRTDAAGSTVVSGPADDRPDAEDRAENKTFAGVDVDYERAVEAIQDEVAGGEIRELSLDQDGRRTTWEADVSVGSEQRTVEIDADSADVISNRVDD